MQESKLSGRELIASVDLVALARSYGVELKKDKGEYVGLCPFHADNNPSFFVNDKKSPNLFCCTPCSMGGNALEFVIQAERARGHFYESPRKESAAAYLILEAGIAGGELPRSDFVPGKVAAEYTVLAPVPPSAPPPVFNHYQRGLPSKTWAYRNAAGDVLFYAARFELANGGKDVMPLSYVQRGEKSFWKWHGQEKPRPLYGLDLLAKFPDLPVVVVEGEKTADAGNVLYAGIAVFITWPGGSNSVRFADWSPLFGRKVLVWPDNDVPGIKAMFGAGLANELKGGVADYAQRAGAAKIRAVYPPDGTPEGWDIADGLAAGWETAAAVAYLKANTRDLPQLEANAAPLSVPNDADGETPDEELARVPGIPYRALGYRKNASNGQGIFSFYSYKANQVLHFTPSNFTRSGLLQLGDADFWEDNFSIKGQGYELNASEHLMNECYSRGVYDPETTRGIGAWLDEGRVVVHAGTHIVEGGKPFELQDFQSKFLYEANRPFGFNLATPLSNEEAVKFSETIKLLSWERPAYADLFIGWCIIAPICGALNWRPHIWLTGPAGSGKTTAMSLLHKLVGNIALHVQGNTTEAAIRQTLNQDARPVCFDEADADGFNDNTRLQTILSLVRAASSHDGGSIMKGGSNGTAQAFVIRSCFAFSSITPKTANAADKGRVSVLTLVKPPELVKTVAQEHWAKTEAALYECFSSERCAQLQARTLSILPTLLANAKVFARAAGLVLKQQRAGDQLGVLLAGSYSLHSTELIEFEAAKAWVEQCNWEEIRNDETDEFTLLAKLMEQLIRVKNSGGGDHERTVGELVLIASGLAPKGNEVIDPDAAINAIKRIGMKVTDGYLFISNTADWITKTLRSTAWASNHSRVLVRIAGAEAVGQEYFATGMKTRAVKIPMKILTGEA